MYAFGMKLTRRGERLLAWGAVFAFLLILGIAGWVEGLPA